MQEKYSDGRLKQVDYVDTLVEELRMCGFDAKTVSNELSDWIECDSVAGTIKYKPLFNNLMYDYYRFLRQFGSKMSDYGLKMELEIRNKEG